MSRKHYRVSAESFIYALIGTTVLCLLAVTSQSLWTDEIGTWEITQHRTFHEWLISFWSHYNSDGQIPLYHAYMWIWVKLFGSGEWTLRAANLPWLFVAAIGCASVSRDRRTQGWIHVCFFVNPFIWYYIDEARPYIVYLCGASLIAGGIANIWQSDKTHDNSSFLSQLQIGIILLLGSSILGLIWVVFLLIALQIVNGTKVNIIYREMRSNAVPTLAFFISITLILIVALHSHFSGARANQTANFSIGALIYGISELLGAAGLGPSRHTLRESNGAVGIPLLMPVAWLALHSFIAVCISLRRCVDAKFRLLILLVVVGTIATIGIVGFLLHWRVVGRHLSALLPLVIVGHAYYLRNAFAMQASRIYSIFGFLLLGGLTLSSLNIGLTDTHKKDDYKAAANWAKAAIRSGYTTIWLADERALPYYGLAKQGPDFRNHTASGLIPFSRFKPVKEDENLPEVIVFSPREGVDPANKVRPLLKAGSYQLIEKIPAFELYVHRKIVFESTDGATTFRP